MFFAFSKVVCILNHRPERDFDSVCQERSALYFFSATVPKVAVTEQLQSWGCSLKRQVGGIVISL